MKMALMVLICVGSLLVAGWCGWMATEGEDARYWWGAAILGLCALFAGILATSTEEVDRKGWFLITPGMEHPSGPYELATMATMWRRGQMPPGTLVAQTGHEWMDVAKMVDVLEAQNQALGCAGLFGGVLVALGLLAFFTVNLLVGAVVAGLGLLFVIAERAIGRR